MSRTSGGVATVERGTSQRMMARVVPHEWRRRVAAGPLRRRRRHAAAPRRQHAQQQHVVSKQSLAEAPHRVMTCLCTQQPQLILALTE